MQINIKEQDIRKLGALNISCHNGVVVLDFGADAKKCDDESGVIGQFTPMNLPLKDLNHLTWREIEAIGKSGKAREFFALGAQKKDYMKDGFVATYQIIGFDHDDLADGSGKAPISWDMVHIYRDDWSMNDESTNVGGWEACKMNKRLNSEFFALCSDDLQSVIKPVIKLTSAGNCSKEIIKSNCKVWLKSEKELYGRCYYSMPGEGHWYEYYRQEDVPYYKEDVNGEKRWNWGRSPFCNTSDYFCFVFADGNAYYYHARYSCGLAPAFSF